MKQTKKFNNFKEKANKMINKSNFWEISLKKKEEKVMLIKILSRN